MSTTGTKKELVDFLWEWTSNLGDWSELLVDYIVQKEDNLTEKERKEVFDYFLRSIGIPRSLPPVIVSKPTYSASRNEIFLTSLSNVKGVNILADNQTIKFSKNLTVVYGENGSGKTGYGRILKSLGFSYENDKTIYSDINNSPVLPSATIDYILDGVNKNFIWGPKSSNEDLQTISFFNNDCVNISLSDDRELIVSPVGFHLFNLITSELTSLSIMLTKAIETLSPKLTLVEQLTPGTPQFNFILNLSANSEESKLIELSTFTPKEEKEMKDSELKLKDLNKTLIEKEIETFRLQISEINNFISKIQEAEISINAKEWEEIKRCKLEIGVLENTVSIGLKEVVGSKNIESYQSPEFLIFLKSAENYIKMLANTDYPSSKNDICIYCRQTLEIEGRTLLANYRKLLNDSKQTQIEALKKIRERIISEARVVDSKLIFQHATFGLDEDGIIIQPDKISEYNKVISDYKLTISKDRVDDKTFFDVDYSDYSKFLLDKKIKIESCLKVKNNLLLQITPTEQALRNKINEIKDRQLLSTRLDEIKKIINYKITAAKLSANAHKFNTYSLSRKTSEAREELVGQNFVQKFEEELKALRKSQINIELTFGTEKGQSKIQQRMKSKYLIREILSEGEQKAIALAEFFTELQLDNSTSPVIFDDPVTSLDHHISDDVARRLIKLSKERQVVIFTHNILLFNSILHFSKQPTYKDLNYRLYNSKKEFDKSGIITEAEEEINSVKLFITKIEIIINSTPKNRTESEIASEGYGYLRTAIELCVEHEIFKATVKRYQKNVALTKFVQIDGILLNNHKDKLNEIFERSCGYITGHSNPTMIQNDPTLSGLKNDFDTFKEIRKEFLN